VSIATTITPLFGGWVGEVSKPCCGGRPGRGLASGGTAKAYRTEPTMTHVIVEDAIPGFSQRLTPGCGWHSSSRRRSMLATARLRCAVNECAGTSTAAAARGLVMPDIVVPFKSLSPVSRNPSCQQRPPSRLATQATGVAILVFNVSFNAPGHKDRNVVEFAAVEAPQCASWARCWPTRWCP